MNTLDELFKEKLADHLITPSGEAWQRVEDGLSKKNKTIVWIRSAAILAFVSLLLSMIMIFRRNDTVPIAVEKQLPRTKEAAAEKSIADPPAVAKENTSTARRFTGRREAIQKDIEAPEPVIVETAAIEDPVLVPQVDPAVSQDHSSKAIVLVYTLGPVEKPVDLEAQAEKDGSLKKVVEFARNVKNTDASPVGELRTMKEDLFALDFKKKTTSKNH